MYVDLTFLYILRVISIRSVKYFICNCIYKKVYFVRASEVTMNDKFEVHANIKFLVKLNKTATETYEMICEAYGSNFMSRARVFEWHRRFRKGREEVKDDEIKI